MQNKLWALNITLKIIVAVGVFAILIAYDVPGLLSFVLGASAAASTNIWYYSE